MSDRSPRSCLVHAILAVLAATCATARVDAEGEPTRHAWVIRPGQEPAIAAMLGGAEGVAGCTYRSANIEAVRVRADFACAGDVVVPVVLSHRPEGPCEGLCSQKFRITVGANAPSPFAEALLANVKRTEARFAWQAPVHEGPHPERRDPLTYVANGAILLVIAVVIVRIILKSRAKAAA